MLWFVRATLILAAFFAPTLLAAQTAGQPASGDRVRIASEDVSGEYIVEQILPESLVLRSDRTTTEIDVPTASLIRVEVSRGRISRLASFLAGALGGGVIGTAVSVPCTTGGHFTCRSVSAGDRLLIGVGIGALVGLVAWGGRENWAEVRVPGQPRLPTGETLAGAPTAPRITREQIASRPDWDAGEIVQRLRPSWLRPRVQATLTTAAATSAAWASDDPVPPPDPAVYPEVFEDDRHFGSLATLVHFSSAQVEAIEFINSVEATTLYGTGYTGGIIRVITRK